MDTSTDAPLLGAPLPVELMNTVWADLAGTHDALDTDADVAGWLRAVAPRLRPAGPDVTTWLEGERPVALTATGSELRALRDALRALAAGLTQDPRPTTTDPPTRADAVRTVNRLAAASCRRPVLSWPEVGPPVAGRAYAGPEGIAAVSWLAAESITVLTGDLALDACLAPGCVLYFVREPARRGWCSPSCGNRARVARHYRRSRTDPSNAP